MRLVKKQTQSDVLMAPEYHESMFSLGTRAVYRPAEVKMFTPFPLPKCPYDVPTLIERWEERSKYSH